MVDYETGKIKTGLFSGVNVGFESKLVRPTPAGEVRSLTMYDGDSGRRLGSTEYETNGNSAKIHGFSFDDWKDSRLPEGFINHILKKLKKKGVNKVTVEIFDVDANTHHKLTVLKNMKFITDTTGNITGYRSWLFSRKI